MTRATEQLAAAAAKLPLAERVELVEAILATVDQPDPALAAAWAGEAEDRFAAYKRGEIAVLDESEVFGDLDNE